MSYPQKPCVFCGVPVRVDMAVQCNGGYAHHKCIRQTLRSRFEQKGRVRHSKIQMRHGQVRFSKGEE